MLQRMFYWLTRSRFCSIIVDLLYCVSSIVRLLKACCLSAFQKGKKRRRASSGKVVGSGESAEVSAKVFIHSCSGFVWTLFYGIESFLFFFGFNALKFPNPQHVLGVQNTNIHKLISRFCYVLIQMHDFVDFLFFFEICY